MSTPLWASYSATSSPQTPAYGPSQLQSRLPALNANGLSSSFESEDGSELSSSPHSPLVPRNLYQRSYSQPYRYWSNRKRYRFGIGIRPSLVTVLPDGRRVVRVKKGRAAPLSILQIFLNR